MSNFKHINSTLSLAILFTILFNVNDLFAQSGSISTSNTCFGELTGTMLIQINYDPNIYSLPFGGEYENIDNGDYGTFSMTSSSILINNLDIGDYEVIIDLSTTVFLDMCATIDSEILMSATLITPSCVYDGSVEISITGGVQPYSFNWSNGSTTQDISSVGNGEYYVTVTDDNGCSGINTFEVPSTIDYSTFVSHVCTEGESNGSITINGHQSWDYIWDTDPVQTTNYINNLEEGTYCVTISSPKTNCDATECFEIGVRDDFYIYSLELEKPCPVDASGNLPEDGSIFFEVNGKNGNVTYLWNDIGYGSNERLNLVAGIYSVTITNSCEEIIESFDLETDCFCDDFLNPIVSIINSCSPQSNEGSITIFNPFLSYNWSNGSTSFINSNLGTGEYTVTITDPTSGCQTVNTYTVETQSEIEISDIVIKKTCSHDSEGSIEFSYDGAESDQNSIYAYWEDEPNIDGIRNRYDIPPGTYTFIYATNCNTQEFEFEVDPYLLDIVIDADLICDGTSTLTAIVSGDNPPYSYLWDEGSTTNVLTSLNFGTTYTVTVTDVLGCTESVSYELTFVEELDRGDACEGIEDGWINLQINNPDNDPITITYDFGPCIDCPPFPVIVDVTIDPVVINLTDLPGDEELTFWIDNGNGCYYPFTFNLGEESWDRVYTGHHNAIIEGQVHDDAYMCEYDLVCHGLSTPIELQAEIDFNALDCEQGLSLDCGSVEYHCEGTVIASRDVEPIWGRVGAIWQLEYSCLAGQTPIFTNVLSDPCRVVRYCPNNPLCYNARGLGEFGGTWTGYDDNIPGMPGCVKFFCSGFLGIFNQDFIVCGLDGYPDYISIYNDKDWDEDEDDCTPIQVSLFQVAQNYEEIALDPDFFNSDLHHLMLSLDGNEEEANWAPEIYCSYAVVCPDDYTIVEEIFPADECGPIDQIEIDGFQFGSYCNPLPWYDGNSDQVGILLLCPNECGEGTEDYCLPYEPVFFPFTNPFGNTGEKNLQGYYAHQIIFNSPYDDHFIRFGFTQQQVGISTPNLLSSVGQSVKFQTLTNSKRELVDFDNVLFYDSDPFNGFRTAISEVEGSSSSYIAYFENPTGFDEIDIYSSGNITPLDLIRIDSNFQIKISYSGSLYYNNQLISSTSSPNTVENIFVDKYGNFISSVKASGTRRMPLGTSSNHICYRLTQTFHFCEIDNVTYTNYPKGYNIIASFDNSGVVNN